MSGLFELAVQLYAGGRYADAKAASGVAPVAAAVVMLLTGGLRRTDAYERIE